MPNALKSFALIALSHAWIPSQSFTPPPIIPSHHRPITCIQSTSNKKIIDAEFTRSSNNDDEDEPTEKFKPISLIEYSQNQDPDWKSMPVAFCDTDSNTYIDCTLAFYVKGEDGSEYALGVPYEHPIVVAVELEDEGSEALTNLATVLPINPDNAYVEGCYDMDEEDKREIFEIAARALSMEFGKELRLKKTPRVLTVQGDLDGVIGDWKDVLLGGSNNRRGGMEIPDMEEALKILDEDEEEGEKYFDSIMRRDLGDDYMKLVEDDDEEIDEDLLKLFDVNVEDLEDGDVEEFLKHMTDTLNEIKAGANQSYDDLLKDLTPSAALRLLSFIGPDQKEYTILRPLRPLLLVGKEDPDDYTRRILLNQDEMKEILPELERVCKDKLEQAGFFLSGTDEKKR